MSLPNRYRRTRPRRGLLARVVGCWRSLREKRFTDRAMFWTMFAAIVAGTLVRMVLDYGHLNFWW